MLTRTTALSLGSNESNFLTYLYNGVLDSRSRKIIAQLLVEDINEIKQLIPNMLGIMNNIILKFRKRMADHQKEKLKFSHSFFKKYLDGHRFNFTILHDIEHDRINIL